MYDVNLLLKQISENNDHRAFEKIFNLYFSKSYHFALYFVKSKYLAEEVVADVFLLVWKNRSKLINIKNWDSYLYISIRNQSFMYLKKETTSIDSELFAYQIEEEDNPERILLKKEFDSVLSEAINQLPPKCKMIYHLVREEKISYKEVAEILNISERTINTQMTIAVKKIGVTLKNYFTTKR